MPQGWCLAEPSAGQCDCMHGKVGACAASASSPSHKSQVEGTKKRKKKRGGPFKEEMHDICVPVNGSFQKTSVSYEMVLLLTWQWPAHVQLVQVKVWCHRRGSCFTVMPLWCKK